LGCCLSKKATCAPAIGNDDYYGSRENDFLMKLLFSATLTNDPNLLSFFNLKYPYYYNITELGGKSNKATLKSAADSTATTTTTTATMTKTTSATTTTTTATSTSATKLSSEKRKADTQVEQSESKKAKTVAEAIKANDVSL
jgi:hypothetical protein